MGSIWGKRVDSWFDRKLGGSRSRADWNRTGLNFLWQAALVGGIAYLLLALLD